MIALGAALVAEGVGYRLKHKRNVDVESADQDLVGPRLRVSTAARTLPRTSAGSRRRLS